MAAGLKGENGMHEVFIEIINRLREKAKETLMKSYDDCSEFEVQYCNTLNMNQVEEVVNQVAEEYSNGWIMVTDGLPEVKINPVTNDYVRYNVIFKNGEAVDTRCYAFGEAAGGKHWLNGGQIMDEYVVAWQPLPNPIIGRKSSWSSGKRLQDIIAGMSYENVSDKKKIQVECPCSVGDMLYAPYPEKNMICKYIVTGFEIKHFMAVNFINVELITGVYLTKEKGFFAERLGKAVFLKEKEAQDALIE